MINSSHTPDHDIDHSFLQFLCCFCHEQVSLPTQYLIKYCCSRDLGYCPQRKNAASLHNPAQPIRCRKAKSYDPF